MSLRSDLKQIIKESGTTMKSVNDEINNRNGTDFTLVNLSKKITHETIRYAEMSQILDILGYDIIWKKRIQ